MNIQTEKLSIIERFKQINDASLIQAIKSLLDYGLNNQQSNQEGSISIEQYNKELDEAEAEMDAGKSISHEDVKRHMKEW
ncbi:MAG: hypothetical protein FVQ77_06665 [Cytophagales bacterium]|nr:hypothetical protein [Cytophagales bacterium]